MRSSVVVLGLLTSFGSLGGFTGCGFSSPPGADDGPAPGDDAPGVTVCGTFASQFDTCRLAFDADLELTGTLTYNTDTHALTDGSGGMIQVAHVTVTAKAGEVDAIVAHDVRLAANTTLRAIGARPFAIVASGSITLDDMALIDVSDDGAGAQPACASKATQGENDSGGAAGGGGGGYGADGGDGGRGNSDGIGGQSRGGNKGRAVGAMPAGPLGGCPGAPGGRGSDPGGAGGKGGGALYLVAGERIALGSGASLTAGGGGGGGGSQSGNNNGDAGGGGGGSGGMILLEAPHVTGLAAMVAANGGGGGEGSGNRQSGNPGAVGTISTDRTNGGAGHSDDGEDGGRGGSQATMTGETVQKVDKGGGGGGGGGAGFVHIASPDVQLAPTSPQAN